MARERIILQGSELPAKINTEQLTAAVAAAAGTALPLTVERFPDGSSEVRIEFDAEQPLDVAALKATVRDHAPARDDHEEADHREQQKKVAEESLRDEIEQLKARVEALERRGRG